jgi:hypothetical protein
VKKRKKGTYEEIGNRGKDMIIESTHISKNMKRKKIPSDACFCCLSSRNGNEDT